ncbi:MAG: glycosyltransferase family 4 protein [Melioribacteraceae bacterium]
MVKSGKKLVYLLGKYPLYSECFIYREISALTKIGIEIRVFTLRRGDRNFNPFPDKTIKVFYIYPENIALGFWLNLVWIIKRPIRYLQIVSMILSQIKGYPLFTILKQCVILYSTPLLTNYLLKENIDFVHAHFANGSTLGLFNKILSGKDFSITLHAFDDLYSNAIFLKEKIEYSSKIICESRYNENYLKSIFPTDKYLKIRTIYSGVEIKNNQTRLKSSSIFRILSIGRLVGHKGFITLIKALKILNDEGVHFEAEIVGEGPLRKELEEIIERENLRRKILLSGAKDSFYVNDAYLRSDLFILSSEIYHNGERDGLPNVVIEAMSFQLPIISTYVSAIPELIQSYSNGILVPERNPPALAQAIKYIIHNPAEAKKFADNGFQSVKKNFDILNTSKMLYEFLFANTEN